MKKILELVTKIVLLVKKLNWVTITWISVFLFLILFCASVYSGIVGIIFSGKTSLLVSATTFSFCFLFILFLQVILLVTVETKNIDKDSRWVMVVGIFVFMMLNLAFIGAVNYILTDWNLWIGWLKLDIAVVAIGFSARAIYNFFKKRLPASALQPFF